MEARQNSTPESVLLDHRSLIERFPYTSRLGSNEFPSDDEVEEIKEFLHEPTTRIQQMDTEIASLLAKVDIIRRERNELKKQVDTCRSLIAISRRLPEDILLEVFFRCLPEEEEGSPTLNGRTAPLSLTAVCRRWRILALRTPKLWSAIHVDLTIPTRRGSQNGLYRMLQMWLERSGTRPLTLSLYVPRPDFLDAQEEHDATVAGYAYANKLLPFASRLMNVSLSLWGDINSFTPFLNIPASEFQSLESMFLGYYGDSDISTAIPIFNAPNLRKVSICYGYPSDLALPWARLTHLDFGSIVSDDVYAYPTPSLSDILGVLNQCTTLIYLGLEIHDSIDDHSRSLIHLPRLQRLSLRTISEIGLHGHSRACKVFAENLQAPSLRQMSMQGLFQDDIFSVLSRHGQCVQRLEVHTDYLTNVDPFALSLQHCPSLRSLLITDPSPHPRRIESTDKTFFSFLNGENEGNTGPCCPLLQEVVLNNINCASLADLVSFLETKQNGDPHVFSPLIKFSTNGAIQEDGRELGREMVDRALKPFKDMGLVVEIRQDQWRPRFYDSSKNHHHFAEYWKD